MEFDGFLKTFLFFSHSEFEQCFACCYSRALESCFCDIPCKDVDLVLCTVKKVSVDDFFFFCYLVPSCTFSFVYAGASLFEFDLFFHATEVTEFWSWLRVVRECSYRN